MLRGTCSKGQKVWRLGYDKGPGEGGQPPAVPHLQWTRTTVFQMGREDHANASVHFTPGAPPVQASSELLVLPGIPSHGGVHGNYGAGWVNALTPSLLSLFT